MESALEITIVLVLILLNGIFAMTELAVMTARKARLEGRASSGSQGARAAIALKERPDRFLSTVQIGITLIGVLSGAFAGATLAEPLAAWLERIPGLQGRGEGLAVAAVVILLTFLSLIFGELVPKQIALNNSEGVASAMARPMALIARIATPFVWLLSASSNAVMTALRIPAGQDSTVSDEEVRLLVQEGREAGHFDQSEQEIIERTLKLGERSVRSLMTHRNDIVWLDSERPLEDSLARMLGAPHHYFPLCGGDIHNVIGIIAVKDVLQALRGGNEFELASLAKPPQYVIGTMTGLRLLEAFRASHETIALVVDEHGSVEGLVTLNDMLEGVVGWLPSVNGEEEIVVRDSGGWLVDAVVAIENFEDYFQVDARSAAPAAQITTVAGLIAAVAQDVPRLGLACQVGPFQLEVIDMDDRRIDKILVTRLEPEPGE
jgi:putative hemolysin